MKPRYAREYKKYGIVAARKPQKGYPVAGVVQVVDGEDSGFAYIRFSEALVTAVGRAMPQGVSADQPCYLKATRLVTGRWRVLAYYLGSNKGCVLWETERPEWLKKIRKGDSSGTHKETRQDGDEGSSRA